MNCIKCSRQIMQGNKYCPYCGTEQVPKMQTIFCSSCGKKIVYGQFCPYCGNKTVLLQNPSPSESFSENTDIPYQSKSIDNNKKRMHFRAVLRPLANGITARNVLWIIIGGLQISAGLLIMLLADMARIVRPFSMWVYFVMGIINLIVGIVGLVFANKVRNVRVIGEDIVDECSFLGAISNYIWNSLVIIGLVVTLNVVSAIFLLLILAEIIVDLVAVRIYSIKHKREILKIDEKVVKSI